jgi:nitroimidazol reductase NimA-like FMN-containing flavoprotein (pyridoxamine 5'-phosphate oxidase superfamily)
VTAERPAELFQLDRATCLALLGVHHVGRLVLGGDEPVIVPVNYRAVDDVITFRTAPDSHAGRAVARQVVFEVDMYDERTHSGWSVIAHGALDAAEPSGDDVDTWVPGPRGRWLAVRVEAISGRLLRGAVGAAASDDRGYL